MTVLGTQSAQDLWREISESFHSAFMLDPEWIVEDSESIHWWPTVFRQDIYASAAYVAGDDDQIIQVTVDTPILSYPDQAFAEQICLEENRLLPCGAFVAEDGVLRLTGSLCLSHLNLHMLPLLQELALVHAARAVDLARRMLSPEGDEVPGFPLAYSEHPLSGLREDRDELAQMFEGAFIFDSESWVSDLSERLSVELQQVRSTLLAQGLSPGWEDDGVFFVESENVVNGVGVGLTTEGAFSWHMGPGIAILGLIAVGEMSEEQLARTCNDSNVWLHHQPEVSLIAAVKDGGPIEGLAATRMEMYVGAVFLHKLDLMGADSLSTGLANVVLHVMGGISRMNGVIEY